MIKAIFFDLDGTLLRLKDSDFYKTYIKLLVTKLANYGYNPDELISQTQKLMGLQYANDGSKTSEQIYYDYFYGLYGKKVFDDAQIMDSFYKNEFKELRAVCKDNDLAKDVVKHAKEKAGFVALTTNPLLPFEALKTRMSFINLNEEDFDFITKYEESHFCKPNPNYFKEVLNKLNLKGEEVILFGNSKLEDAECALGAGIKTYLIDEYLIDCETDNHYEVISFKDIIPIIDEECSK